FLAAATPPQEQRADSPPQLPRQAEARPETTDLHGDPLPPGALARLGTIRFRTPTATCWLAFAPGDTTLFTAGGGPLSAWEVSTGKELHRFGFEGWCYALSPDAKTLATGTQTNVIHLYDVTTGRALREIRGHEDWVRSLAFTADGRTLVSGSNDKTVRFWDVASGKELRRLDESHSVFAVALTPDGKILGTTTIHADYSTARLRDAVTGQELHRFQADRTIFHIASAPDGKTLVALEPANGGKETSTIHLWDVGSD